MSSDTQPPRGKRLALLLFQSVVRTALGLILIFFFLSLTPQGRDPRLLIPILGFVGLIALYSWFFARQLKRIKNARYPGITSAEALILSAAMFLAIFAAVYVVTSSNNPGAFTEELSHFSAMYFALTVLATVGFGDITPVSDFARLVTMIQMALGLAFVAVLVRMVSGAAQSAMERRRSEKD